MSPRNASKPSPISKFSQPAAMRPRSRTAKACDRCRFKKSKCDGGHPCHRCRKFDNPCIYGKHNSKARGKHRMSEILDVMAVAMRRLYACCINREEFPGVLSTQHLKEMREHHLNLPTTHAMLEAMGLILPKVSHRLDDASDENDDSGHSMHYWLNLEPNWPLDSPSTSCEAAEDPQDVESLSPVSISSTQLGLADVEEASDPPSLPSAPNGLASKRLVPMLDYSSFTANPDLGVANRADAMHTMRSNLSTIAPCPNSRLKIDQTKSAPFTSSLAFPPAEMEPGPTLGRQTTLLSNKPPGFAERFYSDMELALHPVSTTEAVPPDHGLSMGRQGTLLSNTSSSFAQRSYSDMELALHPVPATETVGSWADENCLRT